MILPRSEDLSNMEAPVPVPCLTVMIGGFWNLVPAFSITIELTVSSIISALSTAPIPVPPDICTSGADKKPEPELDTTTASIEASMTVDVTAGLTKSRESTLRTKLSEELPPVISSPRTVIRSPRE